MAWRLPCARTFCAMPAFTLHRFLTLTPDMRLACIHNADHLEADEPAVSQEAHLDLED